MWGCAVLPSTCDRAQNAAPLRRRAKLHPRRRRAHESCVAYEMSRSRWRCRGGGAGGYCLIVNFIRINRQKEAIMKQSSKDQTEGTIHELKGKVKEKVGRATNNPNLENEGTN